MAGAPNRAKVRGHPPKTHSEIGLAAVIGDTVRLWRKHGLGYDQTKYVVEHVRRQLALAAARGRRTCRMSYCKRGTLARSTCRACSPHTSARPPRQFDRCNHPVPTIVRSAPFFRRSRAWAPSARAG
jgi:hypothetical protein